MEYRANCLIILFYYYVPTTWGRSQPPNAGRSALSDPDTAPGNEMQL